MQDRSRTFCTDCASLAWNVGVKFVHMAESILLVGDLWDGCRSIARNTRSHPTAADDANFQCVYSAAKIVVVNAG